MGISPLEKHALLALREGNHLGAERALSGYTLDDLGTLLRTVESASIAFEASVNPETGPETVPVEDVVRVIDMALRDDLARWPQVTDHSEGQRVFILRALEDFAQIIEKVCVLTACKED